MELLGARRVPNLYSHMLQLECLLTTFLSLSAMDVSFPPGGSANGDEKCLLFPHPPPPPNRSVTSPLPPTLHRFLRSSDDRLSAGLPQTADLLLGGRSRGGRGGTALPCRTQAIVMCANPQP